MQWYVYLNMVSATAVVGCIAFEWLGRPIGALYRLRHEVRNQMLALGDTPLPKPRELAVTSREISEYDHAVRKLRNAQRTFRDLGSRLLAYGENEPAACNAIAAIGFNPVAAGGDLIEFSVVYSRPNADRAGLRNQIKKALRLTDAGPAADRHPAGQFFRSFKYANHPTQSFPVHQ